MKDQIQKHVLFNEINLDNPMLFVDTRSEDSFVLRHFRRAHNITVETCHKEFLDALSHVSFRNKFKLIFVFDCSTNMELLEEVVLDCETNIAKAKSKDEKNEKNEMGKEPHIQWSNFISVDSIDFDIFYSAYPTATSLYEGRETPPKKIVKHYSTEIVPDFMFLGSYYDATDEVIMTEMRITHVVDATGARLSETTCSKLNITHLHIPVWDMEGIDIAQYFPTVLSFLDTVRATQNGRVLIHCRAGISRSSTFVLAYLMTARLVPSLQDAVRLVVTERPYVLPNSSFRDQLSDYEEALFGTRSFPQDAYFLNFISSINFCWSGIFSAETDHDRIPIIAASQKLNPMRLAGEFPTEAVAAQAAAKPKRPFLKRGLKNPATTTGGCGADGEGGGSSGGVNEDVQVCG